MQKISEIKNIAETLAQYHEPSCQHKGFLQRPVCGPANNHAPGFRGAVVGLMSENVPCVAKIVSPIEIVVGLVSIMRRHNAQHA